MGWGSKIKKAAKKVGGHIVDAYTGNVFDVSGDGKGTLWMGSGKKGGSGGGGEDEGGGEHEGLLREQIAKANEYTTQGVAQAANMDQYAQSIGGIGDSMADYTAKFNAQADALNPYIADYNRYADTLWNQGLGIFNTGGDMTGQGRNLMAMNGRNDPDSLAGRYESWVRQLDPDRYVAMAAQDVQKSYDNVEAQQLRAMGRAGYDASSTKTAEFQQRMKQGLAAALAGAKTRARQQGLSDMGAALQAALGQAEQMVSLGMDISKAGASIEEAGAGLRGDAANLEARKAQIYGMAADNEKSRAAVYNTAAGIWATKAQIYNNAATAMLGGAQAAIGQQQIDLGYYKANLDYQLGQRQAQAAEKAGLYQGLGSLVGSAATLAILA